MRRLYDKVLALAASPRATWWLFAVAFSEASFFPVPPDAMLIPMAIAAPSRAWRYALIALAGTLLGGSFGYILGHYLFAVAAQPILRAYHYEAAFTAFQETFRRWGVWIILVKGLTPIPYKIVTIAAGAAGFSFPLFIVASAVTRGARFFLVCGLLRAFGEPIRDFIERRLGLVLAVLAVSIVAGFVILRYV
jgi:membrane protein YqaA with SNARE-associated domain